MKISIIMPIYNGEKYLKKSITKLLEQPYKNIELILVNDGSTDNSQQICEYFVDVDPRVKLINKKNGGICSARNMGISIAGGEYISFVDQDDEILPEIYLDLVSGIDESIDMVIAGKCMQEIDKNGEILSEKKYIYEDLFVTQQEDIIRYTLNVNQDLILLHIWNCLYKKSIIEKNFLRFDEKFKFGHEDSLFNIEYVAKCQKIHIISKIVYQYYRRTSTSTSMKYNHSYITDFGYYLKKAEKTFLISNQKKEIQRIFFTYSLRLGINLYWQYGKEAEKKVKIKSLKNIYEIIVKNNKELSISIKGVRSKKYFLFLNMINILFKAHCYGIVLILVDEAHK